MGCSAGLGLGFGSLVALAAGRGTRVAIGLPLIGLEAGAPLPVAGAACVEPPTLLTIPLGPPLSVLPVELAACEPCPLASKPAVTLLLVELPKLVCAKLVATVVSSSANIVKKTKSRCASLLVHFAITFFIARAPSMFQISAIPACARLTSMSRYPTHPRLTCFVPKYSNG